MLVGLPGYLYSRLQSVLNAAARSIAGLRRSYHITDTLASFHWLKLKLETPGACSVHAGDGRVSVTERHGIILSSCRPPTVVSYSHMPCRRRRGTHQLDVRQSQCATVEDRAFATAGARLWNSLPADIVACGTLPQFRRELKTFLFRLSYPSILL